MASHDASTILLPWLSKVPLVPVLAGVGAVVVAAAAVMLLISGRGGRPLLPMRTRVRLRMWPGPGFARSRLELRRCYGLATARKIARRGRPSLSRASRRFGPWQQYAGYVGKAHGWLFPARIHTHFEQLRLVIAPPQKGKSAAAVGSIIDDPGPVVATSIRGDLIAASAGLRQQVGTVHIWNPEGAGSYGSTLTWNPVHGCEDKATADRRAGYMVESVETSGLDDASFWTDQASMVLAAYLHAGALAGGTMSDVYAWVLDEDPKPMHILEQHPGAAEFAASTLRRYMALPDRTRAGVSTTLNGALRFMQSPVVAETLSVSGPGSFDIDAFLRSKDTLFLVVADATQSPLPPVFCALLAEIAHCARTAATRRGRLDPPLTLELDEIGNTAPVPVAAWATWAAGSGIRIHVYVQSYAQLVKRWKDHGAETIWQSSDVKIVYSHTTENDLCKRVEAACGTARVRRVTGRSSGQGGGQSTGWENESVLPASALRELPRGRAVVIQGGARPVIVRTEVYWKRRDVRRFLRRGGAPDLPAVTDPDVPVPDPELLNITVPEDPGYGDPAGLGPFAMMPGMPPAAGDWLTSMQQPPEGNWAAAEEGWPEDELAARRRARGGGPPPGPAHAGLPAPGVFYPDHPPRPDDDPGDAAS